MRLVWIIAGAGLLLTSSVWPAGVDTGSPLPAVWKEQHLNFLYLGRTSRYSCEGLRDKLRAMLLLLGARREPEVTAVGCDDAGSRGGIHSLAPHVSLSFASPALPDAGAKPLRPGDLGAVEARFERFTITSDAFRNMGIGDCELVEEFAHQVLPKLVTRDVKEDITCVPNQQSGSRFLIRGEVLHALPRTI